MADLDAITAKLHDMAQTCFDLAMNEEARSQHYLRAVLEDAGALAALLEDGAALRAAALAIEKLRGIKTMGGKPLLACVHVVGPDDLIPAPDGMTAIVWANRLNQAIAKLPRLAGGPDIRAQACLWPYEAEDHAKGLQPDSEYAWLLKDD
jgi:hypothetical protein